MKILSNLSVSGLLGLNSVADANTDTDKFLVLDSSGIVRYRTGAELYNDIGAGGAASYTSTLQHEVKAAVALTKGQAVYVSSADGTNMIVSKASNASEATSSKTLGLIAQNLSVNGKGFVVTEGLLAGLDTSTAGAEGDPVWLGTDGNLIYGLGAKPYAPDHLVFIGIVTRKNVNNGEIFVKVQNGFELQELHNVQITTTPADNTVLAYENSTSLYKMKSISTLLGYTPVTNARSITINGTTYDLSADRTWSVGTVTSVGTSGPITGGTITGSGTIGITQSGAASDGYLSSTDWNTFNNKQAALGFTPVTNARTLTINGTTYDLTANRSWSVGTITGTGTSNYLAKWQSGSVIGDSLLYDTGSAVLIGTATAGSGKFMVYSTTADNHYQAVGSAPSFRFADTITSPTYTGIIGLATASNHFIIGAAAGDMVLSNNTTSSLGNFLFGTGATERMRISPAGNVSINNTNNTYRFDVTGTVRFTGQLRLESTITNGTYTYTLPGATGTLALTSDLTGGTVTSVGLSSATSGVTIGSSPITTSGTITLAIATASGSQQGLLSSTDWTTFNNKQNALTNPVTGTGTTNYLPKFTGTSTIGNSAIYDNSGNIGIGTVSPVAKFQVVGASGAGLRVDQGNYNYYGAYSHIWMNSGFSSTFMTLDASGNLGLGVTPSAWSTSFGIKVIDVGSKGSFYASDNDANLSFNQYFDGTNAVYKTTGTAGRFAVIGNEFQWRQAPSGTAGSAISFTQAMTLGTNSGLSIGTTNTAPSNGILTGGDIKNPYAIIRGDGLEQWQGASDNSEISINYVGYNSGTAYFRNFSVYNGKGSKILGITGSTGAATFSSSVTATTLTTSGNNTFNNTGGRAIDAVSTGVLFSQISGAHNIIFGDGAVRYYSLYTPSGAASMSIRNFSTSTDLLTLSSTGAATFSSSVTATGNININGSGGTQLYYSYLGTNKYTAEYVQSSDFYAIGRSGIAYDFVLKGGNTLIGTTTDAGYKLDVNGTGRFSDYLQLNSSTYSRLDMYGASGYGNQIRFGDGTTLKAAIRQNYNIGEGLEFYTGGLALSNLALYIAPSGAATFSSSVDIGQSATVRGYTGTTGAGMFMAYGSAGAGIGSIYSYNYGTSTYGGTVIDGSYVAFYNSGSEKMRITGGSVGIGTTSPSSGISSTETTLQIQNGNVAALALNNSASRKYTIYSGVGGQLGFYDVTGGAERITLSSSGNVGIGTTSPTTLLELNRASTGSSMGMFITNSAASTLNNSSDIWFGNWGGASISSIYNARISALNTNGTNAQTDLLFYTYGGTGVGSVLERMRITSGGNVGIGTTNPASRFQSNNASTYNSSTPSGAIVASNLSSGNAAVDIGVDVTFLGYIQSRNITNTTTYSLLLNPIGGNVGIGTTSPTSKLHVYTGSSGDLVRIEGASTVGGTNYYSAVTGSGDVMQIGVANLGYSNSSYPTIIARGSYVYSPRDLGIIAESGYPILFQTGGSERMRITSGGDVLIGTSSNPYTASGRASILLNGSVNSLYGWSVGGSAKGYLYHTGTDVYLENSVSSGNFAVTQVGNGAIVFNTNGSERMRISGGGSLLFRSTTGDVYDTNAGSSVESYWNAQFVSANGTAKTILGSASSTSAILGFTGINSSGKHIITAGIYGNMQSSTAGVETGVLQFYTKPSNGGMSSYERMRITSAGEILINSTMSTQSALFYVNGKGAFGSLYIGNLSTGTVYSNMGNLTNTNPSDYRLKNTIKPLTYGLNEVLQLNPKTFYYNDDVTRARLKYGFIAQEVKEVMPDMVRLLGTEDYLGLESEGIWVTLVNAIKEQQAQINELKSQLNK